MVKVIVFLVAISFNFSIIAAASDSNSPSELLIRKSLSSEKPTIVVFSSPYCGPCQKLNPVFEDAKILLNNKINIVTIDLSKEPEMAKYYGIKIMPTSVFYDRNGVEFKRYNGTLYTVYDISKDFRWHGLN